MPDNYSRSRSDRKLSSFYSIAIPFPGYQHILIKNFPHKPLTNQIYAFVAIFNLIKSADLSDHSQLSCDQLVESLMSRLSFDRSVLELISRDEFIGFLMGSPYLVHHAPPLALDIVTCPVHALTIEILSGSPYPRVPRSPALWIPESQTSRRGARFNVCLSVV